MSTESLICISIVTGLLLAVGIFWKFLPKEYKKIQLTVVIEKTSTGYSAFCKEISGIAAVEDNIPALKEQFHEAFFFWLNYTEGEYDKMWPSDFEITFVEN